MFAKLFVLCALAAVALCVEYPAGVNPAICPNYPYCDTALLARYTPDGQPIPEWVHTPHIVPVPTAPAPPMIRIVYPELAQPAIIHKYPADFDPALCPHYPYCN